VGRISGYLFKIKQIRIYSNQINKGSNTEKYCYTKSVGSGRVEVGGSD